MFASVECVVHPVATAGYRCGATPNRCPSRRALTTALAASGNTLAAARGKPRPGEAGVPARDCTDANALVAGASLSCRQSAQRCGLASISRHRQGNGRYHGNFLDDTPSRGKLVSSTTADGRVTVLVNQTPQFLAMLCIRSLITLHGAQNGESVH
jgi:hypothetical protein